MGKRYVSEGVPRWGNVALGPPRREIAGFSKEVNGKTIGFREGPQMGKCSPGAPRREMGGFSKEVEGKR